MGETVFVAIMNKLFILALFFLVSAVSAQPPKMPQNQCQAYKETALGLAKYMERFDKGEVEVPKGCAGCAATLATTIAACLADLIEWPLVVACVAGVIGTGDACYPCICWAINEIYGPVP